ncbi:MAG: lipopolysaccharide transport periplasmic protein LptA [Deltaproteobacteria bacterium]|nr:lipopolysaccharide transport periplasmic protein LptA [Deltaproteobacteria bacterium]
MKKTALIMAAMAALVMAAASLVKAEGPGQSRGPIAISADRLETDDAAGVVHFIGAVVARQGSMTLTCDRMKVFYTVEPSGEGEAASSPLGAGNREIDRVEAFDRVKMVDGDRLAVGDHAIYLARKAPRRLILTGNARVWQGRDSLTGHRVIYFLDEKRSVAESKPGAAESKPGERVTTIIHGGAE